MTLQNPWGDPGGHEYCLVPAIGVLWHPLWIAFITSLRFFRLTGQMAGHPWLASIYYCLQTAGQKASTSALLYKPYPYTIGNFEKYHIVAKLYPPFLAKTCSFGNKMSLSQ